MTRLFWLATGVFMTVRAVPARLHNETGELDPRFSGGQRRGAIAGQRRKFPTLTAIRSPQPEDCHHRATHSRSHQAGPTHQDRRMKSSYKTRIKTLVVHSGLHKIRRAPAGRQACATDSLQKAASQSDTPAHCSVIPPRASSTHPKR
jgi:hypothetical protein